MSAASWPTREICASEERSLLETARLRLFGVNYLQGAISPDLGLFAHLDGSSVLLFALSLPPNDHRADTVDIVPPSSGCVAKIDLERRQEKRSGDGVARDQGNGSRLGQDGKRTPARQPSLARGLSWSQCTSLGASSTAKQCFGRVFTAEAPGASGMDFEEGYGGFVGDKEGHGEGEYTRATKNFEDDPTFYAEVTDGQRAQGVGETSEGVSGHLAVACGSEVRLWRVSRLLRDRGKRNGEEDGRYLGEDGVSRHASGFRYTTAEVLTEWNSTVDTTDAATEDTYVSPDNVNNAGVISTLDHNESSSSISPSIDNPATISASAGWEENTRNRIKAALAPEQDLMLDGPIAERIRHDRACVLGDMRYLSFRPPCPRTSNMESPAPLAAWRNGGVAILGAGPRQAFLPAPVVNTRVCGAWSGCGRCLAIASGGEIRVHSNAAEWGNARLSAGKFVSTEAHRSQGGRDETPSEADKPAAPLSGGVQARVSCARGTDSSDGISAISDGRAGGRLKVKGRGRGGGVNLEDGDGRMSGSGSTEKIEGIAKAKEFRTALCVEAVMQDGGVFSSPGSSPGGSLGSPSSAVRAVRPALSPLSSRRGFANPVPSSPAKKDTLHISPTPGQDSAAEAVTPPATCTERKGITRRRDHHHSSSFADDTSGVSSTAPRAIVGDMRAMCPGGPLCFFATTEGCGLGLTSLADGLEGDGARTTSDDALLGAITSVGKASRSARIRAEDKGVTEFPRSSTLSMDSSQKLFDAILVGGAEEGSDGVAVARRGGFRHVLPGDNWLAGSFRPRASRSAAATRAPKQAGSVLDGNLSMPTSSVSDGCATLAGNSAATSPVSSIAGTAGDQPVELSPKRSVMGPFGEPSLRSATPAAPSDVIDLRGKLNGGLLSRAGGSGPAAAAAEMTHPLFRISLGGDGENEDGYNTSLLPIDSGITCNSPTEARDLHDASDNASTSAADRGPRLMRVRYSSGGDNRGGSDSVKVVALASLPPALTSPDLLAADRDGKYIVVGSHACDRVICYRVSSTAANPSSSYTEETSAEMNIAGESGTDKEGKSEVEGFDCMNGVGTSTPPGCAGAESPSEPSSRVTKSTRRGRRQRRAVPLCTLRLPPGYRAKGISFVNGGHGSYSGSQRPLRSRRGGGNVGDSAGRGKLDGDASEHGHDGYEAGSSTPGSGTPSRVSNVNGGVVGREEGVTVLVLAACPVPDIERKVAKPSHRESFAAHVFSMAPNTPDSSSNRAAHGVGWGSTFRTALLTFVIPVPAEPAFSRSRPRQLTLGTPTSERGGKDRLSGEAGVHAGADRVCGNDDDDDDDDDGGGCVDFQSSAGMLPDDGDVEELSEKCKDKRGRCNRQHDKICDNSHGDLAEEIKDRGHCRASSPVARSACWDDTAAHARSVDSAPVVHSQVNNANNLARSGRVGFEKSMLARDGKDCISIPDSGSSVRSCGEGFQQSEQHRAFLEALEGAERRIGERFDRLERLLLGVSDRVGALEERAVFSATLGSNQERVN